jgi:hypothetical protein
MIVPVSAMRPAPRGGGSDTGAARIDGGIIAARGRRDDGEVRGSE